jgi:IS4 transposase
MPQKKENCTLVLPKMVHSYLPKMVHCCLPITAKFRKRKGAIKMHTLLDLRGNIPTMIHVSDGKKHDVNILDDIEFETNAFYLMDKGYTDFGRLFEIDQVPAFFVISGKDNLKFKRVSSSTVNKTVGLRCDQKINLTVYKTSRLYPKALRRVKFYDAENQRTIVFLTNNFEVEALTIAMLYKSRWQIELFFKWIKQHLRIKTFWGTSPNAVKTQIWIAVCTYLLVAYAKKQLKSDLSLYEITQILSVSVFDKTSINELLTNFSKNDEIKDIYNQLNLFDL